MTLTKIDDRGLNYPLELQDNEQLRIGTNNKAQLYHSGTQFYLNNNNGNIYIRLNSSTNAILVRASDGAVDLYHNGSKKLETTSYGAAVTGGINFSGDSLVQDNVKFNFGASNDLKIYHDGSHNYILSDNGHIHIVGDATNQIKITAKNNEQGILIKPNGNVELYYDNVKKFETTANGVKSQGADHTFGPGNDNAAAGSRRRLAILGDSANGSLLHIRGGSPAIFFDQSSGNFGKIYQDNVNLAFYAGTPVTEGINILLLDDNGTVRIPNDNASLELGASSDLQIYHDGTNSHIKNVTGYLQISATSTDVGLWVNPNGAVRLAYDGAIKLDTRNDGVQITGSLLIGTTTNEDTTGNSGPKLIHTGDLQIDGDQKSILFRSTNSTAQKQSGIEWWNENGAGVQCAIFSIREAVTQAPSSLAFYTTNNVDTSSNSGQGNITNRMVINSVGEFRVQHDGSSDDVVSTDPVHGIGDSDLNSVTTNLARLVMQERTGNWISFKQGSGTHFGTISQSGSGVSYGSNSDYRLKDNVANLTGGITLVKQLRPVTFNWNDLSGLSKTETHQGFIAHEVQALLPDAVSGEKDGIEIWGNCTDGEGNLTQRHVPESKKKDGETWVKVGESIEDQQLDTGKLIPILTKALQEAIAKIETLETKVAVLEAA